MIRITSTSDIAQIIALRCDPERVAPVRELIAGSGMLLRGHYELQSGAHSGHFARARSLTAQPDLLDALARELLELIPSHNSQVILCPESGGFAIGEAVARLAGLPYAVVKTDIHRRPSSELRTGTIENGSRVLLVNDVATSGSSLRLLHRAAEAHGGIPQGALTLATIGGGALKTVNDLGVRGAWLLEALWPLFPGDNCELCKQCVPITLSAELS